MATFPRVRSWQAAACLLMTAALTALPREAMGDQDFLSKPVAVLSFNGLDELLADGRYVASGMGLPQAGTALNAASAYLKGFDTTKPFGLLVYVQGMEPRGIAFLPVRDFDSILQSIEQRFGRAADTGNDVRRLSLGRNVFFRQVGDWVFIADSRHHLLEVPANPDRLTQGLHGEFDVALHVAPPNLPDAMRTVIRTQLEALVETSGSRSAARGTDASGTAENGEPQRQMRQSSLRSLLQLFDGTAQATLGAAVDRERNLLFAEFRLQAIDGSELADQLKLLDRYESQFAGFRLPEAALHFQLAGKVQAEEQRQLQAALGLVRDRAKQAIARDANIKSEVARQALASIVSDTLDVAEETVTNGQVDAGGVMVLQPQSLRFACGMAVADGDRLRDAFQRFVELIKDKPDVPEVAFNVSTHRGVAFHTFALPLPEEDKQARLLFGETLPVTLGTAEKAVYVALGTDGIALLEKILDQGAEAGDDGVPPAQFSAALRPVLAFLASVESEDQERFERLLQSLERAQGQDHVRISMRPSPNGLIYRLEAESGILELVGEGIRMNQK